MTWVDHKAIVPFFCLLTYIFVSMTSLLVHTVAQPTKFWFLQKKWNHLNIFLVDRESTKIGPNFRKQTISNEVIQIVFCYQNCSDLLWEKIALVIEKNFEIRGWRPRICKNFEITRTIYSNRERSEQFLVTECFFNLFLEVSQI